MSLSNADLEALRVLLQDDGTSEDAFLDWCLARGGYIEVIANLLENCAAAPPPLDEALELALQATSTTGFPAALTRVLRLLALTDQEAADRLRVSADSIGRWKKGKNLPFYRSGRLSVLRCLGWTGERSSP